MNATEQADFEAIFGKDALQAKLAAEQRGRSDRWQESAARKLGGALPDMSKGDKPSLTGPRRGELRRTTKVFPIVPVNPLDAGDSWTGPRAGLSDLDRPGTRSEPKARDRFREATAPTEATRKVRTRSGRAQGYQVALTQEEHAGRLAKAELANDAALAIARAAGDLEQPGPPVLLPNDVSRKHQDTAAKVRLWGLRTTLRTRSQPAVDVAVAIDERCEHCGEFVCVHGDDDDLLTFAEPDRYGDEFDDAALALDDHELEDVPSHAVGPDGRVSDWWLEDQAEASCEAAQREEEWDRLAKAREARDAHVRDKKPQDDLLRLKPWVDWITAGAGRGLLECPSPHRLIETAEQVRLAYADAQFSEPPDYPFRYWSIPDPVRPAEEPCVHCHVDPIQTQKDGLCRNCKNYKTKHGGELPPPKVIESRKIRRSME